MRVDMLMNNEEENIDGNHACRFTQGYLLSGSQVRVPPSTSEREFLIGTGSQRGRWGALKSHNSPCGGFLSGGNCISYTCEAHKLQSLE